MAARISPQLSAEWRAKIQTSMLLNRLNQVAMGEVEIDATQLRAIEVALKKTLPDLSSVELTGAEGGPMQVRFGWHTDEEAAPDA